MNELVKGDNSTKIEVTDVAPRSDKDDNNIHEDDTNVITETIPSNNELDHITSNDNIGFIETNVVNGNEVTSDD